MINLGIFDRFTELKRKYKKDPPEWYAFLNANQGINTYILAKENNLYFLKLKPEIKNRHFHGKVETENKIKYSGEEFKIKKLDTEISPNEKNLENRVSKILYGKNIKDDKNYRTIIEGPIHMNYSGSRLISMVDIDNKRYISLYTPGPSLKVILNSSEKQKIKNMNLKLLELTSDEQRHMYS